MATRAIGRDARYGPARGSAHRAGGHRRLWRGERGEPTNSVIIPDRVPNLFGSGFDDRGPPTGPDPFPHHGRHPHPRRSALPRKRTD